MARRWATAHLRRVGIAIGSVVAAWLCVALVGGVLLPDGGATTLATVVTVVLGALIFQDIMRHDAPKTPGSR